MSLSSRIALTAARLLHERAQGYATEALRLARGGAERAARRMQAEGPRITALGEAGLRATEVSCRGLDRLVRQGFASARGAFRDGAERLRMTARAETFGALYAAQRATLPASRKRIAKELGAAWTIVASTSRELADIARSAGSELRQERAAQGRARTRSSRKGKRAPRRRTAVPRAT
jgi:hypothetical protein